VALFAAALTLPLLYVGGSVTTYRVGLAVPDWPETFGINMFLYDFWNAPFGVQMEHSHRLYGALVGLSTLFLTAWFLIFEKRGWLKALGLFALAAVIIQGVLGGLRVTHVSTVLAAIHGVTGQLFFSLLVSLCVFTSRAWSGPRSRIETAARLPWQALALLALIACQIGIGSWVRHFGTPLAVAVHTFMAIAVTCVGLDLWRRIERRSRELTPALPAARALAITISLQVLLGIVALIYLLPFDGIPRPVAFYQAVARTGHQTNGALLLAAAVVLNLLLFRDRLPATSRGAAGHTKPMATPVALDLEAVR
jgi:cytochrome c oxidase assembly protein subunit 15